MIFPEHLINHKHFKSLLSEGVAFGKARALQSHTSVFTGNQIQAQELNLNKLCSNLSL